MSVSQIMTSMKNTNWTLTDDFSLLVIPSNPDFAIEKVIQDLPADPTTFFKSTVVSVEIPAVTPNTQIEHYVGGEYIVQNSIPQVFRFTARFRDINNGELRRWFELLFAHSQFSFGEECYLNVIVMDNKFNKMIFNSSKVLIDNVSAVTYDTNNTNVLEFDISFKTAYLTDDYLTDFGSMMYIANWPQEENIE